MPFVALAMPILLHSHGHPTSILHTTPQAHQLFISISFPSVFFRLRLVMLLPFHCSELCLLSWLCRSFVCPLPFTRWRDPALFDALAAATHNSILASLDNFDASRARFVPSVLSL